ncbi:anchor protein [Opitutaceae bacterium TAV5]|nr:anchor protein [Opitutaceae bacterium TAV5]
MKIYLHHPVISIARSGVVAAAFLLSWFATTVEAATVTLSASDTNDAPGFHTAGNWSDGLAPSSGNDYVVAGNRTLRTGTDASGYVFAGKSLTLGDGTNSGELALRSGGTFTVDDLVLHYGRVANYTSSVTTTLAGNVTLIGFGTFTPSAATRVLNISASIRGAGVLRIENGITIITSSNNTWSGGTLLRNSSGTTPASLDVRADGALGTGNVTLQPGTTLKLGGGTTHQYLHENASLILTTGLSAGSVDLSFVGSNLVTSVRIEGITWTETGTYGAIGSGADHEFGVFTGTGYLRIGAIPEPSTSAAILGGLLLLATCAGRRHR